VREQVALAASGITSDEAALMVKIEAPVQELDPIADFVTKVISRMEVILEPFLSLITDIRSMFAKTRY